MDKTTTWLVRIAATVVSIYVFWTLAAGTVVQMVNLNLQNSALQKALQECQLRGQTQAPK